MCLLCINSVIECKNDNLFPTQLDKCLRKIYNWGKSNRTKKIRDTQTEAGHTDLLLISSKCGYTLLYTLYQYRRGFVVFPFVLYHGKPIHLKVSDKTPSDEVILFLFYLVIGQTIIQLNEKIIVRLIDLLMDVSYLLADIR